MISGSDFVFQLAAQEDEPDIRALVGSVAMPGTVDIRFAREPDYFLGTSIMGDPCDVLVARHQRDGQLAAIACRAEKRAFLNGQESRLGYIGQIRVGLPYRGNWIVNIGAEWFREASPPDLVYYGVIASENPRARQVLVGKKPPAGLKTRFISGLTTCVILLKPSRPPRGKGIVVHPGTPDMLPEFVDFLRENGPRRQFFPAYSLDDFTNGSTLRGLNPGDIMVARRGNKITGLMVIWDQAGYKQDIVDSYGKTLRRLRPAYDLAARVLGTQPLTPPGKAIPLAFAACVCVAGDDPDVMKILLSAGTNHAYRRGKAFLMLGLADNDPLLAVARRYWHITYHSDLFAMSWSDDPIKKLDGRIPYIEIATL
jgi:hypothetical protein